MSSPTQRTLQRCRKNLWVADVVERWQPTGSAGGRRVDLFGCIDVLALDGKQGALGIQATSHTNTSGRVAKILGKQQPNESPEAAAARVHNVRAWLQSGNRLEVWGWRVGLVGRARRWSCRIVRIVCADGQLQREED
jgi:hypothetical protein